MERDVYRSATALTLGLSLVLGGSVVLLLAGVLVTVGGGSGFGLVVFLGIATIVAGAVQFVIGVYQCADNIDRAAKAQLGDRGVAVADATSDLAQSVDADVGYAEGFQLGGRALDVLVQNVAGDTRRYGAIHQSSWTIARNVTHEELHCLTCASSLTVCRGRAHISDKWGLVL